MNFLNSSLPIYTTLRDLLTKIRLLIQLLKKASFDTVTWLDHAFVRVLVNDRIDGILQVFLKMRRHRRNVVFVLRNV